MKTKPTFAICSKPSTPVYRNEFDRIFKKEKSNVVRKEEKR